MFAFELAHFFAEVVDLGFSFDDATGVLSELLILLVYILLEMGGIVACKLLLLLKFGDSGIALLNLMSQPICVFSFLMQGILELVIPKSDKRGVTNDDRKKPYFSTILLESIFEIPYLL